MGLWPPRRRRAPTWDTTRGTIRRPGTAHLADGNPSEALNAFTRYARRLHEELGLEPTERLHRLAAGDARPARAPSASRGGHAGVTRRREEW
ncbi:BTAD domain-containing putative transcriptional regulator [Streptomyces sp. NPDC002913]